MAKIEKSTALVPTNVGQLGMSDIPTLDALFEQGFAQEETLSIGDPTAAGGKKVPIYFGELIGAGAVIRVETMGGKADPVTGEIPMSDLPTYLFNPLNAETFQPERKKLDTIICFHQLSSACEKYLALAKLLGGRAHLLIRWNGKVQTRKGNQMNDISVVYRIVDANGRVLGGGTAGSGASEA